MILPGFPQFIPHSVALGEPNLTAGTLPMDPIDEIGFVSSDLRTIYEDPGPTIGVLSPVPDPSETWLGLTTASLGGNITIKVSLDGDRQGYFTTRDLIIDGIVYESSDPEFMEFYSSSDDFTFFLWNNKTIPFVNGVNYTISIT